MVSRGAREAVNRAMAELGYRPNAAARTLVRNRSGAIGVIVTDFHNPFFADVLDGIDAVAADHGYTTLVLKGKRSARAEDRALETLLELRVDGIVAPPAELSREALAAASRATSVVTLTRTPRLPRVDSVVYDDLRGAALAVSHLVGLGHRRIAMINGSAERADLDRRNGYDQAMATAGLADEIRVVAGGYTEAGGYVAAQELLGGRKRPTAIFAGNDLAALGVLDAVHEAGLVVPGQISVVGYDNSSTAALHDVSLTTVHQPRNEIGVAAVHVLLKRIDDRERAASRIVIPPELVPRATSGAAPAASRRRRTRVWPAPPDRRDDHERQTPASVTRRRGQTISSDGVTVLGNLAVDHIDDDPPSPGGCPAFAAFALQAAGGRGRVVTRLAREDQHLFAGLLGSFGVPVTVLSAERTSAFGLRYFGERRVMTIDAIGEPWTPRDLETAAVDTRWVHVAPLLRSDFPSGTLRQLAATGHCLAYDGQGLVRPAQLGTMTVDAAYDSTILDSLTVLKLADDEAEVVAGRRFDARIAELLKVPEILVTFGSAGCDLYVEGHVEHVPAAWPVGGVHTTGAGDVFTVAYVSGRAEGATPLQSAERASELVARMLEDRRSGRARTSGGKVETEHAHTKASG